jgi:iron complex outermembrane receptor protein
MDRSLVQIDHDHTLVGNRLDLTHRGELFGLRNRFVGGAEVSHTDFVNPRRFSNGNPVSMRTSVFDPAPGFYPNDPAIFSGAGNQTDFTTKIPVYSVFAENAINLSPTWIALAGVRHERITVDRTVVDLAPGVAPQAFSQTYSPTSWRLGTVYSVTPKTQLYGQYSNAVAPVATILLISRANSLFPLTRGTSLEVGLKQSVWDDRAEWTLALYEIEQTNVTTRDPANPTVTTNVGKQSSRGAELAAAVRATRQLTISGSVALVDARFDTLIEAGNANRAGNTPPNVPDRVANARVTYRFAGMPVEVGTGVRHIGAFYTNNANTTRVNEATLFDAFAGWRVGTGTLAVRVRNIGDRLWATWTGASQNQVILGEPRTFELSYQMAF